MNEQTYQIRQCLTKSCGMRYPLVSGNEFGERCPRCGGETNLVLQKPLTPEPMIGKSSRDKSRFVVILDNLRSAWNVGSIFRTADGVGCDHLYLCGITPTPEYPKVAKTALGAEQTIPWSYHPNCLELAQEIKKKGIHLCALETHTSAHPIDALKSLNPQDHIALILGNEIIGVDPGVLQLCDDIWYIPMHGSKRSLNTAVAFGVAAHYLSSLRQR